MVIDAVRGYLQLASGLTEVTRQRAMAAARALAVQAGAEQMPEQLARSVTGLADDLVATSRANRDLLVGLVTGEIDKTVNRLGLVTSEDLGRLSRTIDRLETRLDGLATERARPARRSTARKSATKKSAAKKSTTRKSAAKKSTTRKSAAKKSTTKKSPARKSTAKRSTAKRSTAKRSSGARQRTADRSSGS
jgi:hypothetical protein